MPSFYRFESPSHHHSSSPFSTATHTTPTNQYELKTPHVDFTMAPRITLTNAQLWTLYNFELHALACPSCRNPYHVHRAGHRLCGIGTQLAQSAADVIFSNADKAGGQHKTPVMVEVPADYLQVRSLVQAMDRSLRHPRQHPIVDLRRARSPAATKERKPKETSKHRQPLAPASPKKTNRQAPSAQSTTPARRTPEIVDWPEDENMAPSPARPEPAHHLKPIIKNASEPASPPTPPSQQHQPARSATPTSSSSKASASERSRRSHGSAHRQQPVRVEVRRKRQRQHSPTPRPTRGNNLMAALFGGHGVEFKDNSSKRVRF